jgi:hypothetical protein
VPSSLIGDAAGRDAKEGGHTLVDAVEEAKLKSRETEGDGQVDGHHGGNHFRRDVG